MKTILVVDGNPQIRQSLCDLLRQNYPNNPIVAVPNGKEALFMALYEELGVILLGGDMPIMNGYETAHRLREMPRTRQIPLVAYTSDQERRSIVAGLHRLCDAYLTLPASESQIMHTVGSFVSG